MCIRDSGFSSTPEDYYLTIKKLHNSGYVVMSYDARAHGRSNGSLDFSMLPIDAGRALDILMSRKDVDPTKICVVGHSMGAMTATLLASNRNVSCVVLWAPPQMKIIDEIPFARGMLLVTTWVDFKYKIGKVKFKTSDFKKTLGGAGKLNIITAAKKISSPVLIIEGENDYTVKPYVAEEIYRVLKCDKEMIYIDGADHGFRGKRELVANITSEFIAKHTVR